MLESTEVVKKRIDLLAECIDLAESEHEKLCVLQDQARHYPHWFSPIVASAAALIVELHEMHDAALERYYALAS